MCGCGGLSALLNGHLGSDLRCPYVHMWPHIFTQEHPHAILPKWLWYSHHSLGAAPLYCMPRPLLRPESDPVLCATPVGRDGKQRMISDMWHWASRFLQVWIPQQLCSPIQCLNTIYNVHIFFFLEGFIFTIKFLTTLVGKFTSCSRWCAWQLTVVFHTSGS